MNEFEIKINSELKELIHLLENYQERNWYNYFYNIKDLLDKKDIQGINSLIDLYRGGMGSFNDFYISQKNRKKGNDFS